jgi:hypothetical protein
MHGLRWASAAIVPKTGSLKRRETGGKSRWKAVKTLRKTGLPFGDIFTAMPHAGNIGGEWITSVKRGGVSEGWRVNLTCVLDAGLAIPYVHFNHHLKMLQFFSSCE